MRLNYLAGGRATWQLFGLWVPLHAHESRVLLNGPINING